MDDFMVSKKYFLDETKKLKKEINRANTKIKQFENERKGFETAIMDLSNK